MCQFDTSPFLSLSLVLDRALELDLPLFGLPHEPLQLLLELGVPARATVDARRWVLQGLDGQVDLAVFLDGDDLGLDLIAEPEMLLDGADVVSVDLGDVHEPDLAVFELQERAVRRDALDGRIDDRPDL